MEKMIAIATSLPRTSKARTKLTGIIIDTLWKSLQHPPLSYMGNKFQYRTPDGSYNVSWILCVTVRRYDILIPCFLEPPPA